MNAGVVAPPRSWLAALKPGGRLMFPWRPTERTGLAMLITRTSSGYGAKPLMPAWFIPCIGADVATSTSVAPDYAGAWRTRSVRFAGDQAPDTSATAVYDDIWFSDQPVAVDAGAASASTD